MEVIATLGVFVVSCWLFYCHPDALTVIVGLGCLVWGATSLYEKVRGKR